MENQTENQQENLNPVPNPASQPAAPKKDAISKVSKIAIMVFIASLCLLAIFGIADIWGGFSNDSNDIFAKLEGTLGIITAASFFLVIGLRIFSGRRK